MAQANGVVIQGLNEFRAAVRVAAGKYPSEVQRAIKLAGVPIVAQAAALAPRRTGALASGYKVTTSGAKGNVVSNVPYSGGAEWGSLGKWSGFTRYGPVPRFAGRAVEMQEPTISLIIQAELYDIISAYGWFA